MSSYDVTARIAQLFIYPIKSCAGIEVNEALLTPTGFQHDRHWMLIDDANRFITQREIHQMALITPTISDTHLIVNAPNRPTLSLPLDVKGDERQVQIWKDQVSAFDMGEEVNTWFSQTLGQSVRLVRFNQAHPRMCSIKWTEEDQASTQFSDGYPLLVTTVAAIDELNQHLSDRGFNAVDQRRFRPNIVISDLAAHDEDLLELIHIEADQANQMIQIKNVKPCVRCPIPSIDPDTAMYQPEAVSDAIQAYRQDARMDGQITFGMNAIVLQGVGQMVRVGQNVAADYVF